MEPEWVESLLPPFPGNLAFFLVSKKTVLFVKMLLNRAISQPGGDSKEWEKKQIWQNLESVNSFLGDNCHRTICVYTRQKKIEPFIRLFSLESKTGEKFYPQPLANHINKELCRCAHMYVHTMVLWITWLGNVKHAKYAKRCPRKQFCYDFTVEGMLSISCNAFSTKNTWKSVQITFTTSVRC